MSPSGKKKATSLELQEVEGRLDVLAYRLTESGFRLAERKMGVTGFWDIAKDDIEGLINEHVGAGRIPKGDLCFNLLKKLMDMQRAERRS